jgi:hypothetical protein
VLQWARAHGCDWDAETCVAATTGGHLDVLRWAREYGCPWWAVQVDPMQPDLKAPRTVLPGL